MPLKDNEAYCVTCREACKVSKPTYTISDNGKRKTYMMRGQCPKGHKTCKIISKATYEANA